MSYLERQCILRARSASASLALALVMPLTKANEPRTLYVSRQLENAPALRRWAVAAGLPNVEPAEAMHVTIAFSRTAVRWLDMPQAWAEQLEIPAGGPRSVERMGPEETTVALAFVSDELRRRNEELRAAGASWDWPGYIAHVTVAKDVSADVDLSRLVAFQPRLLFGPEVFAETDEDLAKAKGGGWSKQPRVPSGPKGGQWASSGGFGAGAFAAPHLGLDELAQHRFQGDPAQAAFMKPLTQAEITGKPVHLDNPMGFVLGNPQTPTDTRWNDNPEAVATFAHGTDPGPGLNDVPFAIWDGPKSGDWSKVEGQGSFAEPELPNPGDKRLGAGVIIEEPDGRIWTITPLNNFGGYAETFPKGGIEPGFNLRQTAIKEAWEESGLKVELTGYVGDFERTTSVARYYRGRRVGGSPTDYHWETAATNLVPPEMLAGRVDHPADKPIIAAVTDAPLGVVKAALASANLADLLGLEVLIKAKGKAWSKQPRVPAGLPTGGQWSKGGYGSGAWGASFAAAGVPLQLQTWKGTGPQADVLNATIAKMQTAANTGDGIQAVMAYAQKPKASQTYSAAKWESAQEAVAYFQAKAGHAAEKAAAVKAVETGKPHVPVGTPADPLKLSAMQYIGGKGGSNPGGTYVDADGQQWIVKSYPTSEVAYNEIAAGNAYAFLGVKVPELKAVDLEGTYHGGIGVASKVIPDLQKFDPGNPAHVAAAQADFATHALLGNWDAVGLSFDNLMVDAAGQVHMIDAGGSLLYRAQGKPKGAALKPAVEEFDTMRDPLGPNPQAAKIFGAMTASEIQASMVGALNGSTPDGFLKPELAQAILDGYPKDHPDATKTIAVLKKRMADLGNKHAAAVADTASTAALEIAHTGTEKGFIDHPDPNVQTLAGMPATTLSTYISSWDADIGAAMAGFSGKPHQVNFYVKQVDLLDAAAAKGDIDGVKAAFYDKPSPTANYSQYLKAYNAALGKAQAVAAQNAKLYGKPADGSLVSGAAKVTTADLDAAKKLTGDPTLTSDTIAGADAINAAKADVPKPPAKPVLAYPPALPDDPILASGSNKPVKAQAQAVEAIKALVAKGEPDAAAQIQALGATITGTNTYAKNFHKWTADVVAALGGQSTIDALPKPAKAAAMTKGIEQGAKVASGLAFPTSRRETVAFDADMIPDPPPFKNWGSSGKGLSSKPEINEYNATQAGLMHAAALKNDLPGLMKIDAAPGTAPTIATHLKNYKANLIATLQLVGTKATVTGKPKIADPKAFGTAVKANAGKVAKEIGEQYIGKQNWTASAAEKFGEHVVIGEIGKDIASEVYAALPKNPTKKTTVLAGKLLDQAYAAPLDSQQAWAHHTKSAFSVGGSNWKADVNELLKGTPGSTQHTAALGRAIAAEKGMYELPVGLTVSRQVSNGSFAEWKAMEGKIVNNPATTSTTINPAVWNNQVKLKLTMAEGVRGAYVGNASKATTSSKIGGALGCGDEQELILPRNTKWMVVNVKTVHGEDDFFQGQSGTVVEIVVLPNDPVIPFTKAFEYHHAA